MRSFGAVIWRICKSVWRWIGIFSRWKDILQWCGWWRRLVFWATVGASAVLAIIAEVVAWVEQRPASDLIVLSLLALLAALISIAVLLHIYEFWGRSRARVVEPPILTPPDVASYADMGGDSQNLPGYPYIHSARPIDPELSADECRIEWSMTSSPRALGCFVWNGTPRHQSCKVQLVGVRRWSENQFQFVADSMPLGLYGFDLLQLTVPPESRQPHEVVKRDGEGFSILGICRDRTYYRTRVGLWEMKVKITVGSRSRTQTLVFEWTGAELKPATDNSIGSAQYLG